MILGIIGICLFWTFGFGVLLGILGIVLGAIGMSRADQLPGRHHRSRGLAGVITGVAAVVLGISFIVLVVAFAGESDFADINTDPANGVCNEDRFFQDPDC